MKTVSIAAIRHPQHPNLFLHMRRKEGTYCVPGGHCNDNETPGQGMIRELMEEVGVKPDEILDCKEVDNTTDHKLTGDVKVHLFLIEIPAGKKFDLSQDPDQEADSVLWLDPITTDKPLHMPSHKNLLVKWASSLVKSELFKDEADDHLKEIQHIVKHTKPKKMKIPLATLEQSPGGVSNAEKTFHWTPDFKTSNKPVDVGLHTKTGKLHLLNGFHRALQAKKRGDTHIIANVIPTKGQFGHKTTKGYEREYFHEPAMWHEVKKIKKSEELEKAPMPLDDPESINWESKTPTEYDAKYRKSNSDTTQLAPNLFYHVTPLKSGEVHHSLSSHGDPSDPFAHLIVDPKHNQVKESTIDSNRRGQGYGHKLYLNALQHHGALQSDHITSPGSNSVWKKLINTPGVNGHYDNSGESVHQAKWVGQQKLAASELEKGQNGDWQKEGYAFDHKAGQDFGDSRYHTIIARDKNGDFAGHFDFDHITDPKLGEHINVRSATVSPLHRRVGLATQAYKQIEALTGAKIHRSPGNQSEDAQKLWSQPNRLFGKQELEKYAKSPSKFMSRDFLRNTLKDNNISYSDQGKQQKEYNQPEMEDMLMGKESQHADQWADDQWDKWIEDQVNKRSGLIKKDELQKTSRNVKEQKAKVFGTNATPGVNSPAREKMMNHIVRWAEKRYGLPVVRAPGKLNASGKLIDKPAMSQEKLEHIGNPASMLHEIAHIEAMKQSGMPLDQFQIWMDKRWGQINKEHGYKQHSRENEEVNAHGAETKLRRQLGLPIHVRETKEMGKKRLYSVDRPEKQIAMDIPHNGGTKRITALSTNLDARKPQFDARQAGIQEFSPTQGWRDSASPDALINRRAAGDPEGATAAFKGALEHGHSLDAYKKLIEKK